MDNFTFQPQNNSKEFESSFAERGGFLDSETSPKKSDKKQKSAPVVDRVLPIFLSQLKYCSIVDSQRLEYQSYEVKLVTFVAKIRNLEVRANGDFYTVDDGTDLIEVTDWSSAATKSDPYELKTDFSINTEDDANRCAINTYARFFGELVSFEDEKVLCNILKVVPVTDLNEVTFHSLSVMEAELFFQRGGKFGESSLAMNRSKQSATVGDGNWIEGGAKADRKNVLGNQGYSSAGVGTGAASGVKGGSLTDLMLAKFRESQEEGLRLEELASMFPNVGKDVLVAKVEDMLDAGNIFEDGEEEGLYKIL